MHPHLACRKGFGSSADLQLLINQPVAMPVQGESACRGPKRRCRALLLGRHRPGTSIFGVSTAWQRPWQPKTGIRFSMPCRLVYWNAHLTSSRPQPKGCQLLKSQPMTLLHAPSASLTCSVTAQPCHCDQCCRVGLHAWKSFPAQAACVAKHVPAKANRLVPVPRG